jgi:hypothetical protein
MSDAVVDEVGHIDFLVVEFPRGRSTFDPDFVAELSRLSFEGLIRVLDLLVIQKAADGSVEGFEVEDLELEDVRVLGADLADLLAGEDVPRLASALDPGSVAGVVVWENVWARVVASLTRRAGGQLVAIGHIPLEDIADAFVAEELDG